MSVPVNGGTPGRALSAARSLYVVRYDRVTGEVYFSTGPDVSDAIFRIPATGGTPVEVVSSTWIQDFELDDNYLYLLSRGTGSGSFFNGGVYRMARDGSAAVWLASNQNDPRHLALSTDRVYWALATGEIVSVAKTGVGGVSSVIRTGAEIRSLAVDANYIYWTSDHDVRALPLAGGPSIILASATNSWPHALAVDGAFLYWLNRSGQVMRLAKPGGSGGPPATSACAGNPGHAFPVPISNEGGFGGIVSDGSFVYWSDGQGSGQGSIYKMPISGGTRTTLASGQDQPFTLRLFDGRLYWPNFYQGIMSMPASGASPAARLWSWGTLEDLAVDSSGVWWVSARTQQLLHNGLVVSTYTNDPPTAMALDTNDVYMQRFATAISRQPKSGGPSVQVMTDNAGASSLVISGGFLYWIAADVAIKRMPLSGGPVETLVMGQTRARSLVVDGGDLYWLTDGTFPNYGTGRVKFLRSGAAAPVTLAEAQTAASSITVDAQYVYWLNGGTTTSPGAVMRLAKSTLP
jgi:hypothetical protein